MLEFSISSEQNIIQIPYGSFLNNNWPKTDVARLSKFESYCVHKHIFIV